MSKQIELDDGTIINIYCGPPRADGGERRRIAIHSPKTGLAMVDYPLLGAVDETFQGPLFDATT